MIANDNYYSRKEYFAFSVEIMKIAELIEEIKRDLKPNGLAALAGYEGEK